MTALKSNIYISYKKMKRTNNNETEKHVTSISIKILYNIHITKNYVISPNLLQKYTSYVYSEIYKKS